MPHNSIEPLATFQGLDLADALLKAIEKIGFEQPTPVQSQAVPIALAGKDMLVSAETGSGKTAAFLLPALQRLINEPSSLFGTKVLVLTPTRELAQQITLQCRALAEFTDLKVGLITGGEDFKQQQGILRRNAEVIIATPGRLRELINQQATDFSHLKLLVLDEADRMLDMGFSDDVLNIAHHCYAEKQTLLFSATLTHYGVIKIADKLLKNHYKTMIRDVLSGSIPLNGAVEPVQKVLSDCGLSSAAPIKSSEVYKLSDFERDFSQLNITQQQQVLEKLKTILHEFK